MSDDVLACPRATLADRNSIGRVLGVGGMATVYLAKDLKHAAVESGVPVRQIEVSLFRFSREVAERPSLQQLMNAHRIPTVD